MGVSKKRSDYADLFWSILGKTSGIFATPISFSQRLFRHGFPWKDRKLTLSCSGSARCMKRSENAVFRRSSNAGHSKAAGCNIWTQFVRLYSTYWNRGPSPPRGGRPQTCCHRRLVDESCVDSFDTGRRDQILPYTALLFTALCGPSKKRRVRARK